MQAPTENPAWRAWALHELRAEAARGGRTNLIRLPLSGAPEIALYLKDEAGHPTGSLKHRLARALFEQAIHNGWIGAGSTVVEASSGSTAVSEAYFARLLGLDFRAVVPAGTSGEKIALIERHGGRCHTVADPRRVYAEAERLAQATGGHYLDQFTQAERAIDWRQGGMAAEIVDQLRHEPYPVPRWIVCGAGTGGTSASIGRHLRHIGATTRLCVADPAASVFHRHYHDRAVTRVDPPDSAIEGIGRARVEPSFIPGVIDRMIAVADADGIAAARYLEARCGWSCGPSTGVNLDACLTLVGEMVARGERGAVVTIRCDSGDRYRSTCFDPAWLRARGLDRGGHPLLARFLSDEADHASATRQPCPTAAGSDARRINLDQTT